MDSIEISNYRCFQSTSEVPLKPLTILIGENSSGKSSFLAATRLAWDAAYSAEPLDFNEEPFLLGAYEQIAHFRGGRAGRAANFEIASTILVRPRAQTSGHSPRIPLEFRTTFRQQGSHPAIERQCVSLDGNTLSADFNTQTGTPKIELQTKERRIALPLAESGRSYRFSSGSPMDWGFVVFLLTRRAEATASPSLGSKSLLTDKELDVLNDFGRHVRNRRVTRPVALAPVRSRPSRTYNPISVVPLPEGDHIPMVLAKTFFEDKEQWSQLREALHQFGTESGLFDELDIRALGRSESEPFQLRVKIDGPSANLIDVGYGVSQVLPILVEALLADRGETFLVQQPEVHLHPRAQAALGSFLVRMSSQGKRFIIETHSDYLIDRIRMEVRDRQKSPDDVSLLYFQRNGLEVGIHSMQVDETGNLMNAPSDYRSFFLNEERRLLGV